MKRIYIIICTLLCTINSNAQIFSQYIDEQELMFKVKQIDEFFNRFNYEIDFEGKTVNNHCDSIASDSIKKRQSLTTLLNLDTFAKNKRNLDSLATDFLDYVIKENVKIHYEDSTWMAEAKGICIYGGKEYPICLFLKTEQVHDVIYKWSICNVDCSLFKCITDSCNIAVSIFPGAHGSSFITVPEYINLNAKNVRSLFAKDYTPSALAIFDFMVTDGKMKMKNVTKVKYHFHTKEYDFTVEQFEKDKSYNKGWLVSSITKTKSK